MKIVNIILVALIVVLSIAAGLAKIMQVPEEMTFLTGLGLNNPMILVFGIVQVLGGILTAVPKTRLYGSVLVIIGFFLSVILVFISGNLLFGTVSLLPVIIAGFVMYQAYKSTLGVPGLLK